MERREKVNACKELARRSGQMISMDPDRWGERAKEGMLFSRMRPSWTVSPATLP